VAYLNLKVSITGVAPLLLHNARLANPLDPITQKMKSLHSVRKKTDETRADVARLEWEGSLYVNDKGRVCIPGENIESMIIEAAKKDKLGKQAKAAIIVDGLFELRFPDATKSIANLWHIEKYRDVRSVKVQQARIMRCRPIFREWSLDIIVSYLPTLMNRDEVVKAIKTAGVQCGLGDYRPRFGRFESEVGDA